MGEDKFRTYPGWGTGARWWISMFWHALWARHRDHEAAFWWYIEIEHRWSAVRDKLHPHSPRYRHCSDCGRPYKRWWFRVDHPTCDDLPF